ncbi:MAG: PaaI family thioesterase [Planctomycetes bacterium]|nr:PaaI family thioesterase [Planctomycetota bacterium]
MENSPINLLLGATPEDLPDGRVRLRLGVRPEFANETGATHGGVAAFLLDGAMGRAMVRTLAPGESCATVQLSLQFLSPARGLLTAEARIVRRGRRVAFLEADCKGEDGKLVGRAQGTWALFEKR